MILVSGTIVAQYAALLGLIYLGLSIWVIRTRQRLKVSLGTGAEPALEKVVRIHANFAEYVPLALILLINLELHRFPWWLVHLTCLCLLFGRLLHAVALTRENIGLRVIGMSLTFATLGASSLLLLARLSLGLF